MSQHRIYIAGPYSHPYRAGVLSNINAAVHAAAVCMARGHDALCPHAASDPVDQHLRNTEHGHLDYERWMRLDFGLIRHWATAILYIGPSPGADRELALATELGLTVFRSIAEIPDATPG